jgi:hypothetical protein
MNDIRKCVMCGAALNEAIARGGHKKCYDCIELTHLNILLSASNLNSIFSKKWAANLLIKYYEYLKEAGIKISAVSDNVDKAKKILVLAEKYCLSPYEINTDWLEKVCEDKPKNVNRVRTSFLCFLEELGILKMPDADDLMQGQIARQIERCPKEFGRLIEIYCNTRMELRKRQISNNEIAPLVLKTISCDIGVFTKFVKWIIQTHKEVHSWNLVQEEHVHEFLLTLTPNNRELVRKDLHVLFKLAKRKKIITYIPMMDYPCRELPSVVEPLNISEQKRVARILMQSVHTNPLACILGCLCFFHGLSSRQIQSIKLSDINLPGKKINLPDRSPVYLSTEELLALENYARNRSHMKNIRKREYLFIGDHGATFPT